MELYQELETMKRQLNASIKMLRQNGTKKAEAEREYYIMLRQEALRLRDEGESVGMVTLTVKGLRKVADLRFERDVADVVYNANQEAINALKLQMKLTEAQIQREWGSGE